ncbi:MAG: hypothetical protein RSC06_07035 [Clostridia bacterium]
MEKAIANVCRVDIITNETTPVLITIDTSDEVGCEPSVSEGKEEELRVKNKILAQNITEDLVKGYNLTLKDTVINPDSFALIDGGALTFSTDKTRFTYAGPQTGAVVNRKKFTLDIWTEEKDTDGESVGYQRFRFRKCKGTPVKFSIKDGGFFAPEYTIKSRPGSSQSPVDLMSFDNLPGSELTAAQVLTYAMQVTPAGK